MHLSAMTAVLSVLLCLLCGLRSARGECECVWATVWTRFGSDSGMLRDSSSANANATVIPRFPQIRRIPVDIRGGFDLESFFEVKCVKWALMWGSTGSVRGDWTYELTHMQIKMDGWMRHHHLPSFTVIHTINTSQTSVCCPSSRFWWTCVWMTEWVTVFYSICGSAPDHRASSTHQTHCVWNTNQRFISHTHNYWPISEISSSIILCPTQTHSSVSVSFKINVQIRLLK